jgi:hypothetical protein
VNPAFVTDDPITLPTSPKLPADLSVSAGNASAISLESLTRVVSEFEVAREGLESGSASADPSANEGVAEELKSCCINERVGSKRTRVNSSPRPKWPGGVRSSSGSNHKRCFAAHGKRRLDRPCIPIGTPKQVFRKTTSLHVRMFSLSAPCANLNHLLNGTPGVTGAPLDTSYSEPLNGTRPARPNLVRRPDERSRQCRTI